MKEFESIIFTDDFLHSFADRKFSASERRLILKTLELLDQNERHPSLRVHALEGRLAGYWSCSANTSIRITFVRLDDGRKRLASVTRHYDA